MYKFIGIMIVCLYVFFDFDEFVYIQQVRDNSKSFLGEFIKGRFFCLREFEIIYKFQIYFEGVLREKV